MIHLTNTSGSSVWITEIGASIASVVVPDKNGNMADVALGYKDNSSYFFDAPFIGKTPGRYANRIAKGYFELEGKAYQLATNNGPNHLHGGKEGFSEKEWKVIAQNTNSVTLQYISPDGEENYPGELTAQVIYTWCDDNTLRIELGATTDKTTVINLTNHAYWNLAGENSGSILEHKLKLNADHWLPTSESLIPTGEIASVEGTPMDFRQEKSLGQDINADFAAIKYGKGYDNCWVLRSDSNNTMRKAATLSEDNSGRKLEVYTTQPSVQVYTGNWLAGSPISKSGRSYNDYEGVAIECQNFPDAPNHPNFPSSVLKPGEEYKQIIEYRFGLL